ncbi:MAG: hypothetical protein DRH37_06715 [Deltaproteobacteria bacterium]|nr:MAG: hypothetical protein DRH37_06715 [Deltaproteobacteria bacterium]
MQVEEGVIEKASGRKVSVRIQQSAACATCESRGSCEVASDKKMVIEVTNDLGAKIGDRVEISIPESSLLTLSFLVYFLPSVALIAGAFLGAGWGRFFNLEPASASIIGGAMGVGVVFCLLKWLDRGSSLKQKYYPRMTRILISAGSCSLGGDSR